MGISQKSRAAVMSQPRPGLLILSYRKHPDSFSLIRKSGMYLPGVFSGRVLIKEQIPHTGHGRSQNYVHNGMLFQKHCRQDDGDDKKQRSCFYPGMLSESLTLGNCHISSQRVEYMDTGQYVGAGIC